MAVGERFREQLEHLTPTQQEQALNAIATLEGYAEVNPLYYYNHETLSERPVHWKQMAFHKMPERFRALFGGNQSGKTMAGLVDDVIQAISWEAVPEHLKFVKRYDPPCYIRILATDSVTLELTHYVKLKEITPSNELVGNSWQGAFNAQNRVLRFKNGSMIQFMTYRQDPMTMGGATIHRIHYDEEPPQRVFEENSLRVMKHGGDQILTMTPLLGLSWTYQAIAKRYMRPEYELKEDCIWESDRFGIVRVDMDDNPYLTEEDKRETLANFPPEVIEARKHGKFVHFAGLIYGEFNHELHILDDADIWTEDKKINPHINVVVSIDPGIRNQCAVLWAAIDTQEKVYVFEELYEQGKTVKEICDLIRLVNAEHGINPIYYVIDPAARNINMQTGRSDQMEFTDNGIVTIAGQHKVEAGINRIKERLRNQGLFIFSNCRNLISEFEEYRWREAPRSGEDGKPQPVKTRDHAMDSLRYLIMSRPYAQEAYDERDETYLQRSMRLDRERSLSSRPSSPYGPGIFA